MPIHIHDRYEKPPLYGHNRHPKDSLKAMLCSGQRLVTMLLILCGRQGESAVSNVYIHLNKKMKKVES